METQAHFGFGKPDGCVNLMNDLVISGGQGFEVLDNGRRKGNQGTLCGHSNVGVNVDPQPGSWVNPWEGQDAGHKAQRLFPCWPARRPIPER